MLLKSLIKKLGKAILTFARQPLGFYLSLEPKIETACITKHPQTLDCQSQMTYLFKKQGSSYHWILDLYERMGLPELEKLKKSTSHTPVNK